MAEETKNASVIVPRCMIWSYLLNGSMGFVMLITYCFCLTNVDAALDPEINRSGFPYIYVCKSSEGCERSPDHAASLLSVRNALRAGGMC